MPGDESLVPAFKLSVDGASDPELSQAVIGIRCNDELGRPSRCQLQLSDIGRKVTKGGKFKIGTKVEVKLGFSSQLETIFKGEVVGLEVDLSADKPARLFVIARDKQHRLHRGTVTKASKDVKDSDLATKVAQKHGLTPDVDDSGVVHPFVMQNNLPDYAFLVERAAVCGFHFWVDDAKLHFKKIGAGESSNTRVKWGESLSRFWQEVNLFDQVATIDTHAFDPKEKKEIKGPAKKGDEVSTMGSQMTGAEMVKKWYGDSKHTFSSGGVAVKEMESRAKSEFNKRAGRFITAEGRINGNPKVSSGAIIQVENTNQRVDGTYYVTETQHLFYTDVGYATEFYALRWGIGQAEGPTAQKAKQRSKVAALKAQLDAKNKNDEGQKKAGEKASGGDASGKSKANDKPSSYWLELNLVDSDGKPLVEQRYGIKCSNGEFYAGMTDDKGHVRIDILTEKVDYEVFLDLGEFPEKTIELEPLEFTVQDKNGRPAAAGAKFIATGPEGRELTGNLDDKSHAFFPNVPKGDWDVKLDLGDDAAPRKKDLDRAARDGKELKNARWSQARAAPGDKLKLNVDCPGAGEGDDVELEITDATGKSWDKVKATIDGRKAKAEWTVPDLPELNEVPSAADRGKPYKCPRFYFTATWRGKTAESAKLELGLNYRWDAVDERGRPLSNEKYTLVCADGSKREGRLSSGTLVEYAVAVGWATIQLEGFGEIEVKNAKA